MTVFFVSVCVELQSALGQGRARFSPAPVYSPLSKELEYVKLIRSELFLCCCCPSNDVLHLMQFFKIVFKK